MTTLRLMALVFGVALTLLLMDYASAEPTESAKKATESQKEAINTPPPSMELRKKTFEEDRIEWKIRRMFKPLSKAKRKEIFKRCQLTKEQNDLEAIKIAHARIEDTFPVFLVKAKLRLYG